MCDLYSCLVKATVLQLVLHAWFIKPVASLIPMKQIFPGLGRTTCKHSVTSNGSNQVIHPTNNACCPKQQPTIHLIHLMCQGTRVQRPMRAMCTTHKAPWTPTGCHPQSPHPHANALSATINPESGPRARRREGLTPTRPPRCMQAPRSKPRRSSSRPPPGCWRTARTTGSAPRSWAAPPR